MLQEFTAAFFLRILQAEFLEKVSGENCALIRFPHFDGYFFILGILTAAYEILLNSFHCPAILFG